MTTLTESVEKESFQEAEIKRLDRELESAMRQIVDAAVEVDMGFYDPKLREAIERRKKILEEYLKLIDSSIPKSE